MGIPAALSADTETVAYNARKSSAAPASPGAEDSAPAPNDAYAEPLELDASLIQAWREWTEVVEGSMTGRRSRINEPAYRDLHQRLSVACASQMVGAGKAAQALLRKMAEALKPWLTLQSLASTDRATLASLYRRCKQIDGELGLVKNHWWPWTVALVLLIASGGLGWLSIHDSSRFRLVDTPYFGSWWGFLEKHPALCLAILLPLFVCATLLLLKRLLRS